MRDLCGSLILALMSFLAGILLLMLGGCLVEWYKHYGLYIPKCYVCRRRTIYMCGWIDTGYYSWPGPFEGFYDGDKVFICKSAYCRMYHEKGYRRHTCFIEELDYDKQISNHSEGVLR